MRFVLTLALLVLFHPTPAPAQEPTRRDLLAAVEKRLQEAAETAGPSIACVVVSRSDRYPKPAAETPGKLGAFDPKEFLKTNPNPARAALAKSLDLADPVSIPDHGYAGGVVIDPAGLILTPYHAIEGARKIYVYLPGGSGSYADIHAADSKSDLAVLKLIHPPARLTPIRFGHVRTRLQDGNRATVFPGKLVILMANPYTTSFRFDRPSAAFGSITNVRYRIVNPGPRAVTPGEKQESHYKCGPLLEHDVRVNANVTGGALLNLNGELIGLTTTAAIVFDKEIGPGYAIPADDGFQRIVDVLKRGEEVEYGFLGVTLPQSAIGVEIDLVTPLGPAQRAGLRGGDIITHINGYPAENYDDLLFLIGASLAGSKARLKVNRFGERFETEVTLAKFRNQQPYIATVQPGPVFGLRVDYDSILAVRLTGPRNEPIPVPAGVCVREVADDSPADKQFKTIGNDPKQWLITHVNGAAVTSPAEFYRAARGQDKIKLTIIDPKVRNRTHELILP